MDKPVQTMPDTDVYKEDELYITQDEDKQPTQDLEGHTGCRRTLVKSYEEANKMKQTPKQKKQTRAHGGSSGQSRAG
jgi:hypothetical protein